MIFFTIISKDFIPVAKVLHASVAENYSKAYTFYIFIASLKKEKLENIDNVEYLWLADLVEYPDVALVYNKYANVNLNFFRYSLKPVIARYLLNENEKVIYCDPDLYFTNSIDELDDLLEKENILLTPHWFPLEASDKNSYLKKVFNSGLFNAGFVGFHKRGMKAVDWWADACAYHCYNDCKILDAFVDQSYLDVFPVYFDKVKILHPCYNVGGWSTEYLQVSESGDIFSADHKKQSIKFIHFSPYTINKFRKIGNQYLSEVTQKYDHKLSKEGVLLSQTLFRRKNIFWYLSKLLPKKVVDRYSTSRKSVKSVIQ